MDSNTVLRNVARDFEVMVGDSPIGLVRIDEGGWLGLSGEKGFADLNMAAVFRSGGRSLLEEYVREIEDRELQAILIVEADAPEVEQAAADLGLTHAGAVPVMVWEGKPAPVGEPRFKVRLATERDLPDALHLASEAFALDEEKVRRVFQPSMLERGLDVWLAEDESGPVGCGMFVARGDHVGIYTMSTPASHQRRGIGRAVLDAGISHYLERGATTFTLEATEAGFHLYEQVGFEVVGTPSVYVIGMSTQFTT
jgi:ribosomal protein S18 acetylase RimI-like enzyme